MTDYLQEEIECLAKVRKDQMMNRLKSTSNEPALLHLIAELLISIEYKLNRSKRL